MARQSCSHNDVSIRSFMAYLITWEITFNSEGKLIVMRADQDRASNLMQKFPNPGWIEAYVETLVSSINDHINLLRLTLVMMLFINYWKMYFASNFNKILLNWQFFGQRARWNNYMGFWWLLAITADWLFHLDHDGESGGSDGGKGNDGGLFYWMMDNKVM